MLNSGVAVEALPVAHGDPAQASGVRRKPHASCEVPESPCPAAVVLGGLAYGATVDPDLICSPWTRRDITVVLTAAGRERQAGGRDTCSSGITPSNHTHLEPSWGAYGPKASIGPSFPESVFGGMDPAPG